MLWHMSCPLASALSPGACVSETQFDLSGATHIVLIHLVNRHFLTRLPGGDEGARVDDPAHKSCPT